MNRPSNGRRSTRRGTDRRPAKIPDPWIEPAPLPDLDAAPPADEPSALLRSLGEPPLADGDHLASYFAAAIERAAAIATALALSAELPAADVTTDASVPETSPPA